MILMEQLKAALLNKGASLVGFAKIEGYYGECEVSGPNTVDSEKEIFQIPEYPYGISIAVNIPKDVIKGIKTGPTIEYYNAYHNINQQLDSLALYCEEYLKGLGYEAYAQTVEETKEYGIFRTLMPHKTIAVASGIGWIGKSALFVTKEYGSAVRLTSVLTNAPLQYSKEWIASPCQGCMICRDACPGHAITGNGWDKDKGRDWIFDALACRKKAREIAANTLQKEITLCGKCIEVCPYTRKYYNSFESDIV